MPSPNAAAAPLRCPTPPRRPGQALARMHGRGPPSTPSAFLTGAEQAFRMIVSAFAAGDRDALRPLLTDDTFRAFEGAIAAREAAGETQRTEIRAIPAPPSTAADLRGTPPTSPCASSPTR